MHSNKNYKKILKKYHYPFSSEKELLEIVQTIEILAKLFCEFKKGRRKLKKENKYESN